jgi:hypothetical protein
MPPQSSRRNKFISVILATAIIFYPILSAGVVIAESEVIDNTTEQQQTILNEPEQTPPNPDTALPIIDSPATGNSNPNPAEELNHEILPVSEPESPPEVITENLYDEINTNEQAINNDANQLTQSGNIIVNEADDINNATTGDSTSEVKLANIANNITLTNPNTSSQVQFISPSSQNDITINLQPSTNFNNFPTVTVNDDSLKIAIIHDNQINNNVNVVSTTGYIDLIANDDIDDVRTGNAMSTVDILNMANSIIAGGDVMVGVINVDGNYSQDIIIGQDIINKLLAPSVSPQSNLENNSINNLTNNLHIINDVNATANSGDVLAINNDEIDIIKTGDALTDVNVINLANSYTIYDNSLLIVVNTTGQFSGDVLGASGSNVYLLSYIGDSPNLLIADNNKSNHQQIYDFFNTTIINNKVNASALSGNITLIDNDNIDSASSGNATVKVRIFNGINHITSFADWFGVLFINIFGNWDGNIVAQRALAEEPSQDNNNTIQPIKQSFEPNATFASLNSTRPVFFSYTPYGRSFNDSNTAMQEEPQTVVLASNDQDNNPFVTATSSDSNNNNSSLAWLMLASLLIIGLALGSQASSYRQTPLPL